MCLSLQQRLPQNLSQVVNHVYPEEEKFMQVVECTLQQRGGCRHSKLSGEARRAVMRAFMERIIGSIRLCAGGGSNSGKMHCKSSRR